MMLCCHLFTCVFDLADIEKSALLATLLSLAEAEADLDQYFSREAKYLKKRPNYFPIMLFLSL
jgi:hypothetical protein